MICHTQPAKPVTKTWNRLQHKVWRLTLVLLQLGTGTLINIPKVGNEKLHIIVTYVKRLLYANYADDDEEPALICKNI